MTPSAALDHAHVWHPFTPMRQWRETDPLVIDHAEGFHLIDEDGNRYLDGVSSLWCNVHGHRVPAIDDAIRKQLNKVAHSTMLGLTHEPAAVRPPACGADQPERARHGLAGGPTQ